MRPCERDSEGVKLSAEMLFKCRSYAEEVFETNAEKYAERGQSNRERIVRQNTCGKLAELATEQWFSEYGIEVTYGADFRIYDARRKKHDADLRILLNNTVTHVAVKSCDRANALERGLSWVFQYEQDGADTDDLFFREEGHSYISCVGVDLQALEARIFGIPKVTKKLMGTIAKRGIPMVAAMRSNKRVLYPDFLDEMDTRQRWQLKTDYFTALFPVEQLEGSTR